MALPGSGRLRTSDIVVGTLASAGAVALVTAVIGILDRWVPVLSLGALYVFAVLLVAIVWGLAFALPVAVASMLAFNWFFLPPTHTLHLRDGENWLVLALYLVVAVVTSELAARARRRAREAAQREREASLLAEVAVSLLGGRAVTDELDDIAGRAAVVLGAAEATIVLGPAGEASGGLSYPLTAGGRTVGVISAAAPGPVDERVVHRFLPALASLLAVALDREELQREVLEAEALRHSDAVKTTVLRAVSHDLRSPLTAITAAAGGLQSTELDLDADDRAELVATILSECGRLERMVSDLLDLSRLEAGAVAPVREIWTVDELVGAALDELHDHGTAVDVPADLPPVEVDAGQARRILVNLLENAKRHATTASGVRVSATRTGAGTVELRVSDDGPGLEAADPEVVFEPFWRGARGGGRTGLGLAIARGFAEANGGSLRVESAERGTTMMLTLPVAAARPVEAPA